MSVRRLALMIISCPRVRAMDGYPKERFISKKATPDDGRFQRVFKSDERLKVGNHRKGKLILPCLFG